MNVQYPEGHPRQGMSNDEGKNRRARSPKAPLIDYSWNSSYSIHLDITFM